MMRVAETASEGPSVSFWTELMRKKTDCPEQTADSVREMALVYDDESLETADAFHQKALSGDYQGTLEALALTGHHYDCLHAKALSAERISGYRALYMMMSGFIPESIAQVLRDYVSGGGTVIAGMDFSRVDREGEMLGKFAMEDFLGVRFAFENDKTETDVHAREYRESSSIFPYAKVPEAYVKVTSMLPGMDENSPMAHLSDAVVRIGPPYIEYAVTAPLAGTRVLAELFLPSGGGRGELLTFPYGHPPAVTERRYGRGCVLYIAGRPGYAFYRRGLPECKKLVAAIADYAVGGHPLVSYSVPGALLCTITNSDDGWCVTLENHTGAMLEQMRREIRIAPLRAIDVSIREDRYVESVEDENGLALPFERQDGYIQFRVDEIRQNSCVKLILGEARV